MIKVISLAAAVVAAVFSVAGPVMAGDSFGARLLGSEEVPVISTNGQGFFYATLNDAETQLDYQMYFINAESTVTQSHIHIGQKSVNGGIVLYLCTNLNAPTGVPTPPACPNGSGFQSVAGTLTAANVVTQAGQGISAGEFAEVVRALKAGNAYANIHSATFAGGEVRGQITR
jgi:hypothetical protein